MSTGLTQVVAPGASTFGGATWGAADVIVFPEGPGGLSRVSAQGGPVALVTKGARSHFWPQFLGDGEHFIYAASIPAEIWIGSVRTAATRALMTFPMRISALAHVPGYVLFVQDGALFARPFDDERLEFSGEPVQILDGIPVIGPGRAPFSVSAAGVLAFWRSPPGMPAVLQWFDRDGRSSPAVATPARYVGFALAPDGRRLAFSRTDSSGNADLWLRDVIQGDEHQLTFDGAAFTPHWSPDGKRVLFSGPGDVAPPKLFIKDLTGTGAVSRVVAEVTPPDFASSWAADGGSVVSVRIDPANRSDVWAVRLQDRAAERLPFNTESSESHGIISPDSRWIAYTTDKSGTDEVWVASFPSGTIQRQVSAGGGTSPQWGDGNEIFYISPDDRMMSALFSARPTGLHIETAHALFRIGHLAEVDRLWFPTSNPYVAASTGQRFLVAVGARDSDVPPITIVVNWVALLQR